MNSSESLPRVARNNAVSWSFALVVCCGLLLGYYILQTYFSPKERGYQLDFGNAQWIEPQDPGPIAYFRTKVFLSTAPKQAWLEVAATDNFKLIINNHTVGTADSVKMRVTQIFDVKKHLRAGTNVIAVSISRLSYPGPAQLLVKGFIKQPSGKVTDLITDEQWKVTTNTGIVSGSAPWTSALVDDQLWPNAVRAQLTQPPQMTWVNVNPLIYFLDPAGSWLLSQNASPDATFATTIKADHAHQEAWIQVASSGNLDLLVNGHLITPGIDFLSRALRLPNLPAPVATPSPQKVSQGTTAESTLSPKEQKSLQTEKAILVAYDVSYWIKRGNNSIVATVRADHRPASVFVSGFLVKQNGSYHPFWSNSDWTASEGVTNSGAVPAVEFGENGSAPWGYLEQETARPVDHSGFGTFVLDWLIVLLTAAALVALWLIVSAWVANRRGELFRPILVRDGLFHAPILVLLLFLLLFNYDIRFPAEWAFQGIFVFLAIVLIFAVRIFHWFPAGEVARKTWRGINEIDLDLLRRRAPYFLLFAIMGLGLALRLHNITFMSFDHDEMGLISKSKGIYKLGIPYTPFAGEVRWATTYEAVPYPLALFGLLGYSELTMRLPSCIMGTLAIGLMALIGRRLFNSWRIGLIAAFIYACMPVDIRWAQNAFYPQQCQFMALLTILLFFEAIRTRPFRRKYLTAAAIVFCITYLSWEGSAFLLPSLFVGLALYRWGEWWWLKDFHLYRCLFFVGVVVVAQYCSRTIAAVPYLQVGSGLSNLTGPSLFFLTPLYQPLFYVNKLLLTENHVFFTVLALLVLPLCWKEGGYRYLFSLLISLWILHTNFLAALAPRYCYYYQPLVILVGVAAAIILYDRVILAARRDSDSPIACACVRFAGVFLIVLLFLQSNEAFFRVYNLSSSGDAPGLMTRMGIYRYNYRDADHYVEAHLEKGDVVFPGIPHVYAYYVGRPGDYFINTLLGSKVPYNQTLTEPRFVDKFAGLPVVRNLKELKEVTNRAPRTWLVFAPYASFVKLNAPEVLDYIDQNARVVFETYRAKVYLMEGASHAPPTKEQQTAQVAE